MKTIMTIDMVAAMFITLPIILPAVQQLGYDAIWFGVLVIFLAEIALATPPFGLGLFIINGVIEGSTLAEITRGVMPFIVADPLDSRAFYLAATHLYRYSYDGSEWTCGRSHAATRVSGMPLRAPTRSFCHAPPCSRGTGSPFIS